MSEASISARISPALLLRRLSQELAVAARLSEDLSVAEAGSDMIIRAQGQDLLQQTLSELALFLERAAITIEDLPPSDLSEALAKVRLSSLASRLSGRQIESTASGEVDFF